MKTTNKRISDDGHYIHINTLVIICNRRSIILPWHNNNIIIFKHNNASFQVFKSSLVVEWVEEKWLS